MPKNDNDSQETKKEMKARERCEKTPIYISRDSSKKRKVPSTSVNVLLQLGEKLASPHALVATKIRNTIVDYILHTL